MQDTRDIIIEALTAAGNAHAPLAGGHHAEDALEWDRQTYPVAVHSVEGGVIQIVGENGPGNPRLQRRQYSVLVEIQDVDNDDIRQRLAGYRVALEKALLPHNINVPIEDIVLVLDTKPAFFDRINAKGTVGVVGLVFEIVCYTLEGSPEVILDPSNPIPVPVSGGLFDE